MVRLLIANKADLNTKDLEGRTLLHVAVYSRNQALVEFLLNYGIDLTARAKNGSTPIDIARTLGPRSLANYLSTKTAPR